MEPRLASGSVNAANKQGIERASYLVAMNETLILWTPGKGHLPVPVSHSISIIPPISQT